MYYHGTYTKRTCCVFSRGNGGNLFLLILTTDEQCEYKKIITHNSGEQKRKNVRTLDLRVQVKGQVATKNAAVSPLTGWDTGSTSPSSHRRTIYLAAYGGTHNHPKRNRAWIKAQAKENLSWRSHRSNRSNLVRVDNFPLITTITWIIPPRLPFLSYEAQIIQLEMGRWVAVGCQTTSRLANLA